MPSREYALDTGFTTGPLATIDEPKSQQQPGGWNLQSVADSLTLLAAPVAPALGVNVYTRNQELFHSAFRLENDVLNAWDLINRPVYKPDPAFNVVTKLKEDGLWDDYRDNFLGVESLPEYLDVASRIKQEQQDQTTLLSNGPLGLLAAVAAGSVSPTVLLPFVGQARGWWAVAKGAGWGLVGGLSQELPLQMAQETRSLDDSVFSVAGSTVLGAVLGGAVGYLNRSLDDMATEMGGHASPGDRRPSAPRPGSVGAAALVKDARLRNFDGQIVSKIADVAGDRGPIGKLLGSPIVQNLTMQSPLIRFRTAQLTNGGLDVEGTPVGGTIEARVRTYDAPLAAAIRKLDELYADYFFDGKKQAFGAMMANVGGMMPGRTKMSKAEFKAQVHEAMMSGDTHAIPQVQEAAQFARKQIFDPVLSKAEEVKLFKRLKRSEEGDVEVAGDISYLNRDYNKEAISRRANSFVKILSGHIEGKLQAQFQDQLAKIVAKQAKDAELVRDLKRPYEEIEKLITEFKEELETMFRSGGAEDEELDAFIRELQAELRDPKTSKERLKEVKERLREIQKESDDPKLVEQRERKKVLNTRLRNLNKAASNFQKKQDGKLERINRLEELQQKTILRTIHRAQKFLQTMDSLQDDVFEMEISELQKKFEALMKSINNTEKRIGKLAKDSEVITPDEVVDDIEGDNVPELTPPDKAMRGTTYTPIPQRELETAANTGDALDIIIRRTNNQSFKAIAERIRDYVGEIPFSIYEHGDSAPQAEYLRKNALGYYNHPGGNQLGDEHIGIRGESFGPQNGLTEETILHEAIHAATASKMVRGEGDLRLNVDSPEAKLVKEWKTFQDFLEREIGKWPPSNQRDDFQRAIAGHPREFITYGLTESTFQSMLKQIKMPNRQTAWNTFVNHLTKFLGIAPKEKNALAHMIELSDETFEAFGQPNIMKANTSSARVKLMELLQRQKERADIIQEELQHIEGVDRGFMRRFVQDQLDDLVEHTQQLNARRAVRAERLRTQALALDPKIVQERIAELERRIPDRAGEFRERWRERGLDDVPTVPGQRANFEEISRTLAHQIKDKILGTNARLAGYDILYEAKGAELARLLDIPSHLLKDADGTSFLEQDVEKLWHSYIRTLAPDIEVTRQFGEMDVESGRPIAFQEINDEQAAVVERYEQELDEEFAKKHPNATPEQVAKHQENKDKKIAKLNEEYELGRRNLEGMLSRLRHTWGVPRDPGAFATRAARTVMNLNVLRFMGGVTISSIPDIAQPIMRYGMGRVFRDGWLPMLKGLKNIQATKRELQLAGAALDVVLHSRANQIWDIGDYMVRGSKFEKAVDYASSRMGLLAAFDYWTAAMKQVAGSTAIASTLDDVVTVVEGAGDVAGATQRLARYGIDGGMAQLIHQELTLTAGGGKRIDGVWWPNTESWSNPQAVEAFRTALVAQVNDTIITPGLERPLWTDASLPMRMLTQFKSFAFSSTTKTLMANLQKRDMATVQGVTISLALGALSYYLYAMIAGGQTRERLEKALANLDGSVDPDNPGWQVFVDEAIARSGVQGSLGLVQDAMSQIPLTAPYVTFSGQRSSRRGGQGITEAMLGPSFDMLTEVAGTAAAVRQDEPYMGVTQSTIQQASNIIPLQNHFALRWAFDKIGEAAGDAFGVPERRQ